MKNSLYFHLNTSECHQPNERSVFFKSITTCDEIRPMFRDGLMPTESLVQFETQAQAGDSKARPIFAVHPIEGFANAFKRLAAKLSVPVYGLQCIATAPLTSLTDLAEFYINQIKSVQKTGPYIIVGYSFGASVAFEMGTLLENAGEKSTLVMLDGAPRYLFSRMELYQQQATDTSAMSKESAIAMAFYLMVFGNIQYVKMSKELDGIASLDLKLKHVSKSIAQKTKFPVDAVQLAAISFAKKMIFAHDHKPKRKLTDSNVILFKPNQNDMRRSHDYGLSEVKFCMNLCQIDFCLNFD